MEEDLQKGGEKENKLSIALYKILAFLNSKIKSEAIWCFSWFLELAWAGWKIEKTESNTSILCTQ